MSDDTVDFRDLLNTPLSDYPDMPNLPGSKTFFGKAIALSAGHSRDKGTPFFHLDIRLTDPGQDVSKSALDTITEAGFSLADYTIGKDFYLTPKSMIFLRRFLTSIGCSQNVTFREALKLADDGNPTEATQDIIRGQDVLIRTPPADEQGRVYLNNVDFVAGTKR